MSAVDATRRVFISYTSKDRGYAETILKALERRGISCWFAPRDVPGGANYTGTIWRAIQTAEAMVVVLSRNANGSDDMKKEVVLAGQKRLPIIAVRIDTVALDADWAYEFSLRQVFDGSMGLDQIIRNLGDQLRGASAGSREERSVVPPLTPPVPPASPARPAAPSSGSPAVAPGAFSASVANAPPAFGALRHSRMVPLVVLASVIVISFTLGVLLLSGSGNEISKNTVMAPVASKSVIALPAQKCDGYVPTYPRAPGTC